jgi:glycosyltransferase involved in cell wall biosynthesis
MKILHYINNLGSGGAEKLLTYILPLMQKKGNEVSVLICNSYKNVDLYEQHLENGNIKIINFQTSFYNPLQIFSLIKLIRKENYDIVHAHLFPTQYWLGLGSFFISKNTKFVKTEHNVNNRRRGLFLFKIFDKIIYKRFDKIIGITLNVKESLSSWLSIHDCAVVINNGVNISQISKSGRVSNGFNFKMGYNILMVASFDGKQKDQLSLLKALNNLPENFNLYFAGEGPFLNQIKLYAKKYNLQNRTYFMGMRKDIYFLMNNSDINILSSNYEGLSGVTLESLASGKPFLGSNVPGIKDIVPDQSYLFPKGNYKVLAQKILEISNNKILQHEMVSKAKSHVLKYDINLMVSKYLELYNRLLKK